MNGQLAAGFVAAVLVHALVLFAFRLETPARPLAMSNEPSAVDVALVEAGPEAGAQAAPSATPAPAEPAPTPAPPEPTPEPTPQATPEPQTTPEMSTPPPEATPEQESMPSPESTPAPQHPKAAPHHSPQKHSRASTAHSAPGATGAAGPGSATGATGHGAAGRQLGSHARYLSNPRPDYPEEARLQHQEGVVLVSVEVGTDGRPSDVSLARSSGFSLLDAAALQAVRRWTFEPAETAGLPVSSRVEVPVRFSLSR